MDNKLVGELNPLLRWGIVILLVLLTGGVIWRVFFYSPYPKLSEASQKAKARMLGQTSEQATP